MDLREGDPLQITWPLTFSLVRPLFPLSRLHHLEENELTSLKTMSPKKPQWKCSISLTSLLLKTFYMFIGNKGFPFFLFSFLLLPLLLPPSLSFSVSVSVPSSLPPFLPFPNDSRSRASPNTHYSGPGLLVLARRVTARADDSSHPGNGSLEQLPAKLRGSTKSSPKSPAHTYTAPSTISILSRGVHGYHW